MRETRIIMGMPISVELVGGNQPLLEQVFAYFRSVDARFSTYKPESEVSQYNRGEIKRGDLSAEMREVLALAEQTRRETDGFFDIRKPDGSIDPSGIVKGWAIRNAAHLIKQSGLNNFFVDAGGDIQSEGKNAVGEDWKIGIRSPFNEQEIIKVIEPKGRGVATSGTYIRGQHIYNPHAKQADPGKLVSLTVVGSDVLEADRFATAAFAMGDSGIYFLERSENLEAYAVNSDGIALQTTGFGALLCP